MLKFNVKRIPRCLQLPCPLFILRAAEWGWIIFCTNSNLVYRVNVKGHDVKRWPKTDTALGIYHFYKRCIVRALLVCRKRILWRNRRPIQYGFGDVTKDFEYILKCPSIIYKSYYWLKLSCEVIPRFLSESSLRRGLRAWSIITGAKTCKTEKKKGKEKDWKKRENGRKK